MQRMNDMIYFVSDGSGYIKIGVTNDIASRMKQLQTGNPHPLKVIRIIECRYWDNDKYWGIDSRQLENTLHYIFRDYRVETSLILTEWFKEEPVIEFLKKTDNEIAEIINSNSYKNRNADASINLGESNIIIKDIAFYENENTRLWKLNNKLQAENKNKRKKIKELEEQIEQLRENAKCTEERKPQIYRIK